VSVKKILEMGRETWCLKQFSEEGDGGFFKTGERAEQEFFMFVQKFFPRIQRGNCYSEMFTNCRNGRVPLEIGGQSGEFET